MSVEIRPVRLVLVFGSLRRRSSNEAVVRTIDELASQCPVPVEAVIYQRMGELPHYNPDDDQTTPVPVVQELRETLERCDGIIFSTPEYAGSLPGSFKNLLDWTVGGGMYGRPVAWINASAHGGAEGAYTALRAVLSFTGAHLVEDCCRKIAVKHGDVGPSGSVVVPEVRKKVGQVLFDFANRVREHRAQIQQVEAVGS